MGFMGFIRIPRILLIYGIFWDLLDFDGIFRIFGMWNLLLAEGFVTNYKNYSRYRPSHL